MDLRYKEENIFRVEYTDLEEFLKYYYGKPIEIHAALELDNKGLWELNLKKKRMLEGELQLRDKFIKDGRYDYKTLDILLQNIININIIPEGTYIIDITI